MARPTLLTHPKFAKLAARLKSRSVAIGSLELIWQTSYASGDPVIGDSEALEAVADWHGEGGELAAAMVASGFVDLQMDASGGRLHVVHDLEDHAPDYVVKRWEREAKRKEAGKSLREVRQSAARSRWAAADANVRHLHASVRPPTPAPAPISQTQSGDANVRHLHATAEPSPQRASGARAVEVGVMPRSVPETRPVADVAATEPSWRWSGGSWLRRFGLAWAAAKGRLAYGRGGDADTRAAGKLTDLLDGLPDPDVRSLQDGAADMFRWFLEEDGEVAKAGHQFSWFVGRFPGLRLRLAGERARPKDTARSFTPKPLKGEPRPPSARKTSTNAEAQSVSTPDAAALAGS